MPFGLPNVSIAQVFRLIQTFAVPLVLAYLVREVTKRFSSDDSQASKINPSLYSPLLQDIGFRADASFPVSFTDNASAYDHFERVSIVPNASTTGRPDTTAVLLNWARFPNVLLITSMMCSPELESIIAQVLIWNNTPRPLSYEDFKNTGCPPWKLNIVNSYGNVLFQGRYLGCSRADTPYCFVQDDDYLIRPEIVHALHARLLEPNSSPVIHLLPPHDHLTTSLREIHVAHPETSHLSDVHTSFAWLGYGTIMERSQAVKFITMMRELKLADKEIVMADNYFTILGNRVPEFWLDQNFELGGGFAFTEGQEGEERNVKHIRKATEYLNSALLCRDKVCDVAQKKLARTKLSYLSTEHTPAKSSWTRAACKGSPSILETNIRLLPETLSHSSDNVENIFALEASNREKLGESSAMHYVTYPPSHAVDADVNTAFRSPGDAKKGDIVLFDVLSDLGDSQKWEAVELAMIVTSGTKQILDSCSFEFSTNKVTWLEISSRPRCEASSMLGADSDAFVQSGVTLHECSVNLKSNVNDQKSEVKGRYFRLRLQEDQQKQWEIHELWLRGALWHAIIDDTEST